MFLQVFLLLGYDATVTAGRGMAGSPRRGDHPARITLGRLGEPSLPSVTEALRRVSGFLEQVLSPNGEDTGRNRRAAVNQTRLGAGAFVHERAHRLGSR